MPCLSRTSTARRVINTAATLFALLLAACSGYEVTLNDAQVYKPTPLFTAFKLADINLQNCIDQTIKDKKITAAQQLTQLNCAEAGIVNLAGIEIFTRLVDLKLSHNKLVDVAPLGKLAKIEQLYLNDNNIENTDALLSLLQLRSLDLTGNAQLNCSDSKQLQRQAQVLLPVHCR